MGKITNYQPRKLNRTATVSALIAMALVAPGAGLAQSANPPGFSLRPGGQQEQPPSDVQGPVDAESNPPRRTDEPARPTPDQALPAIAPVPVPQVDAAPRERPRDRAPDSSAAQRQRAAQTIDSTQPPATPQEQQAQDGVAASPAADSPAVALLVPDEPLAAGDARAPVPQINPVEQDRSIWLWLAAGIVAVLSLIAMAWRQRSARQRATVEADDSIALADTVPTPLLRNPRPAAQPAAQPAAPTLRAEMPRPAPAPAPAPTPVAARVAPAAPQPPRLLLDYTTLGVDVTLINAVARYHLGITNMSAIAVSDVVLHGSVVQARRGMPPTIDPLQGDSLLPQLQQIADIQPDATQRCEGQIRLPLAQIDPIRMQGRMLFVPVVHIWIGYCGPDGTRYAVTQSFVLGEESTPPGPRVGPLRLELGPRRFTAIGQRPLLPA